MKTSPKNKILFIITKSNWGGAQRYVYDIATNLDKNNFEVVISAGQSGDDKLFEKIDKYNSENISNIQTIKLSYLKKEIIFFKEIKAIREILKIIDSEKPKIIHLNSPKASLLGSVAGTIYNIHNKQKIKIIQTIHGFPFLEPRSIIWKTIMWIGSYISLLLSDKNIFISKNDLNISKKMFFVNKKSIFIQNGISEINFISKKETRLKMLSYDFDGILIGTIAELNKNKGIKYFLESLGYLKDEKIKSIIIGDGESRSELEELNKSINTGTIFTGQVDNAYEYLKAFDIFVLPSLKEGLPYVLIEAGFAELPVISTTVGGIPNIIESGINGTLIPPKDSKSLAVAIELYLKDDAMRKEHAKKLHNFVKERFKISEMLKETVEIYNKS
ncbi:MAG TPA: glycosyltransferase [Candidatus Paceibacterota bacterium]|nr:glycosyltransferase [Candidatus Paceibacterota bacterium]HMP19093.1 glycosyltransferase [Candidatus Paceibacterota bacterium]